VRIDGCCCSSGGEDDIADDGFSSTPVVEPRFQGSFIFRLPRFPNWNVDDSVRYAHRRCRSIRGPGGRAATTTPISVVVVVDEGQRIRPRRRQ
jgi:hypothetical protein